MSALDLAAKGPSQYPNIPQDWRAYNAAQVNEKAKFLDLLRDLCGGIAEPERQKNGRPPLPISDALFAACFKIYSTVSGRRFMTDLRDAQAKGYIAKVPHYNSIFNYLENPALTPILRALITESSRPLNAIEVDFAADSSGFTTSRFHRWYDHKYGVERQEHDWVKVHLMCGVSTHIVTAVEIHDRKSIPKYSGVIRTNIPSPCGLGWYDALAGCIYRGVEPDGTRRKGLKRNVGQSKSKNHG